MLIQDGRVVEPEQLDMAKPWWWTPALEGLRLDQRDEVPPQEMDLEWPPPGWDVIGATTDGAAFLADEVGPAALILNHWEAERIMAEYGYLPPGFIVARSQWLPEVLPPAGAGCWRCITRA